MPAPARWCASRLARSSSSAYVRRTSPNPTTSASRSGTASTTTSKMSARLRSRRLFAAWLPLAAGPCPPGIPPRCRGAPTPRRPGALLTLPTGGALLQEGADALLGVAGHGVHRHDGLGQVVGLALVEIDLAVEGLLAEADHQRAGGGDLA